MCHLVLSPVLILGLGLAHPCPAAIPTQGSNHGNLSLGPCSPSSGPNSSFFVFTTHWHTSPPLGSQVG